MKKTGFMNIYRSGVFHRIGKPCTYDRHPGDFYGTREEALKYIEPASAYIGTVPVEWDDPEDIQVNPHDSIPLPLFRTRHLFERDPHPAQLARERASAERAFDIALAGVL